MRNSRLILAGAGVGLLVWWIYSAQRASKTGETIAEAALNGADDFVYEAVGYRAMGQWFDDLNGRGAPYKQLLLDTEEKYGIPEYMLARLAWQESRFRADIISGKTKSSAGALGIMQIVPRWHPGVDPLNPAAAIDYAGKYLKSLYRQFGNWEYALKAYNWGPGNVKQWLAGNKAEPLETRNYSSQILADIGQISGGTMTA